MKEEKVRGEEHEHGNRRQKKMIVRKRQNKYPPDLALDSNIPS